MHTNRFLRILLIVLAAFLGVTAIGGGIALLLGIGAPPVEMLSGSPFDNYVIPGLALLIIVGGSALAAALLLLRRHPLGAPVAGATGLIIIFFEFVEVLSIGSDPGAARNMQVFYFGLGLLMVVLAGILWMDEHAARLDGVR